MQVYSKYINLSECTYSYCYYQTDCVVTGDTCKTALGMQSEAIPDSAITASSSYDFDSVGPARARFSSCFLKG